jgi:hypothetical protein
MPTALSDPSLALYVILIVVAAVTGMMWSRNRSRSNKINFGIAAAALIALFLIDWFVESPREEASRRVREMAAAASDPPNPDRFVENVSESFSHNGKGREAVRTSGAWDLVRQHNVRVAVWSLDRSEFQQISENEIEIGFYAKAESPREIPELWRQCKARFIRDPDGAWRVKGIKFYSPGVSGRQEDPIPQFP